jgi:ABC-2 type transport system permease protein
MGNDARPMTAPLTQPTARETAPRPRRFGAVNWLGLWTLYAKECLRFRQVWMQSLLAPIVTALLFFTVFTLALGRDVGQPGISFAAFLAPGLVIMAMAQAAFANSSGSLMVGKIQGNIVDLLMPPLSPLEVTLGLVLGAVTRGLAVGALVLLALAPFVALGLHNLALVVFHAVAASLMLAQLGLIGGIWGEKFDHIAALTNFVVMPLTFLSGTFYSIERLPESWHAVARANPFHYMIDGFRYGFTGLHDSDLLVGVLVLLGVNLALGAVCLRLIASGWKLKP